MYAALGTPFATFLMATYYRGISDDLIEAAVMDGLGVRAHVPADRAAAVAAGHRDRGRAAVHPDLGRPAGRAAVPAQPGQRTITFGLAALSAGRTTTIPVLMAGSFVSAVPAIIVYLIFQRYLVRGLTLGMRVELMARAGRVADRA